MDEQKYPNDQRAKDAAGESVALDDERRVKVLSPGMLVFKRFVRNKLAIAGAVIIISMFLFSFLGGILMPYSQSQVFKEYQPMLKDYAAVTTNEDYRYVEVEGQSFDSGAKSRMIAAINAEKESFEYGGKTYGLIKEGERFYRISDMQEVASGKGIKTKFKLNPVNGVALPSDFTAAFDKAMVAGESVFTTANGESFTIQKTKVQATVLRQQNLALASQIIFTGEQKDSFDFRLAAERAMQGKTDTSFTVNDVSYNVAFDDDAAVFTDASGVLCGTASHFVMKATVAGMVFPEGFDVAVQQAIADDVTTFIAPDADGTEHEYQLERKNKQYIVRSEMPTYQIAMYRYPSWEHLLGTDGNGMDVLTRLMYGGRISLMIGFVVVLLETALGVILGGIAGYFGRWVDNLIMRVVDIFNCIPSYPIYIIMGAIMDAEKVESSQRIFYLMIAMGILGWPGIARIVRGQILSLREQEFMTAAEATGISTGRRIFRHLVPNVIPQLIVIDTMTLGGIILTEATLSFLGLGVKYPLASWGSIINAVSNIYVMTNYWFVWIPAGMLILLTVLGFNFIGDGLRDAFDPKMKR
ncbi:MAG: ABC transporter permease [Clostridia bacterium]